MSKNFVREINNINNINKQEFYTNKANDLLSTKEHNYIRKQKREYHCLTDNVKQTNATNVRYTDTTASPNVNYNLISVDNTQVPKNNTNTISASSLVSALEAKDTQIKALRDELEKVKTKAFQGVLKTYATQSYDTVTGYITAKNITSLTDPSISLTFLVEFNFTGKLTKVGNVYKTYVKPEDVKKCCINFPPIAVGLTQYMDLDPTIYVNGLKFNSFKQTGEVTLSSDGTYTNDNISTSTSFTLVANGNGMRDQGLSEEAGEMKDQPAEEEAGEMKDQPAEEEAGEMK